MGGCPSSAGSTWRMPTKSKKRRPKKDGPVSYQQVSLAQPNMVLREVDYIVERAARCDPRFVTLGQLLFFSTDTGDAWMSNPRIIWRCVWPRLAAASPSRLWKQSLATPSSGRPRTDSRATLLW